MRTVVLNNGENIQVLSYQEAASQLGITRSAMAYHCFLGRMRKIRVRGSRERYVPVEDVVEFGKLLARDTVLPMPTTDNPRATKQYGAVIKGQPGTQLIATGKDKGKPLPSIEQGWDADGNPIITRAMENVGGSGYGGFTSDEGTKFYEAHGMRNYQEVNLNYSAKGAKDNISHQAVDPAVIQTMTLATVDDKDDAQF